MGVEKRNFGKKTLGLSNSTLQRTFVHYWELLKAKCYCASSYSSKEANLFQPRIRKWLDRIIAENKLDSHHHFKNLALNERECTLNPPLSFVSMKNFLIILFFCKFSINYKRKISKKKGSLIFPTNSWQC